MSWISFRLITLVHGTCEGGSRGKGADCNRRICSCRSSIFLSAITFEFESLSIADWIRFSQSSFWVVKEFFRPRISLSCSSIFVVSSVRTALHFLPLLVRQEVLTQDLHRKKSGCLYTLAISCSQSWVVWEILVLMTQLRNWGILKFANVR